ncbi:MAG: TcpQ domain-containing protein [Rhodospirillales bacterium]|nr:TcpQ domain-containing protein [Rhodospirillales bacterium]
MTLNTKQSAFFSHRIGAAAVSRYALVTFSVLAFIAPQAAQAGFEWKPADHRGQPPAAQALVPLPPEPVMEAPLDDGAPDIEHIMIAPVPLQQSPQIAPVAPVSMEPIMPAPMEDAMPASASTKDVVVGFGNDMPLILAMRQIVPDNYAYSFAPQINQAVRVNWNGGQPWDVVLAEAVAPYNLDVDVIDQTVVIGPKKPQAYPAALPQTAQQPVPMAQPVQPMAMAHPALQADPRNAPPENPPRRKKPALPMKASAASAAPQPLLDTPVPYTEPEVIAPQADDAAPLRTESMMSVAEINMNEADIYEPMDVTMPAQDYVAPQQDMPAPVPSASDYTWQATKDASLRQILTNWSNIVGAQIIWNAPRDYYLPENMEINGDFVDAVQKALTAFGQAGARPVGSLYPNAPSGPLVLVISESAPL